MEEQGIVTRFNCELIANNWRYLVHHRFVQATLFMLSWLTCLLVVLLLLCSIDVMLIGQWHLSESIKRPVEFHFTTLYRWCWSILSLRCLLLLMRSGHTSGQVLQMTDWLTIAVHILKSEPRRTSKVVNCSLPIDLWCNFRAFRGEWGWVCKLSSCVSNKFLWTEMN